jgi:hypothetical protein
LIYREAVNNLNHFSSSVQEKKFVFAGFNALNAAEEKIIQHLIVTDQAKFIGMQIKRFLTIRIMMQVCL